MSNLLKITQPSVSSDGSPSLKSSLSATQQLKPSSVQPASLSHADVNNISSFTKGKEAYFASNFDVFLQALRQTPSLTETMVQLLFDNINSFVGIESNSQFSKQLTEFMQFLNMNPDELFSFTYAQVQADTKFQGPIFEILRRILSQTKSEDVQNLILKFLKIYDNAQGATHTIQVIYSQLEEISQRIPSNSRNILQSYVQQLNLTGNIGANSANLTLLKEKIIPFLSDYITSSKDFGPVRDIIGRLVINLSNYENGTTEKLLQSLQRLLKNPFIAKELTSVSAKDIESLLSCNHWERADTGFTDSFINIIARGLKGEGGDFLNKDLFYDILKSILLNKSVYMPLQYIFIPAHIYNKTFFSEIWVDPNADNTANYVDKEPASKIFIKFSVQEIGQFEMIILHQKQTIDMLFFCPANYVANATQIQKSIAAIFEKNGFLCQNVSIEKLNKPLSVVDVFPKILKRKDTINARV